MFFRYFAPIIIWGGILLAFVLLLASMFLCCVSCKLCGLLPCLPVVMIVSWYEFVLFNNPDLVDDSDLSDDGDFIDELNSELDWWEYQEETWLAIGKYHHCTCAFLYNPYLFIKSLSFSMY